ncbi:FAD/NAD(P)-binding domain-containing protein [Aspergillus ellipticus CBS 707.79]|uniref:FAD/NAD(P)-binding domain-containing protein n=1 Tax=Aspergillus ellipticus CBS 707.79 TaxID=1448320 RepID=A0A319DCI6_9EURO|nr:FAD/NAD(P)-binding domain-containing protein [Aspergillus ellipticus CBS 707.79]
MARFHRAHLQRLLLDSLPDRVDLQLRKRIVSVRVKSSSSAADEGVVIGFQEGTTVEADLLVGADGIHSAVRWAFVPGHAPRWTGGIALRSTFDVSLVEGISGLPDDAVFYAGHDRNLFVSRLGRNQFTVAGLLQFDPDDPQGLFRGAKWNAEGDVTQLRAYFKDWHPTARALVEATPYTRVHPNLLGAPLEMMVFDGRVALLGDAGHTHGGAFAAGGSLAINDAHALALALAHTWPTGDGGRPNNRHLAEALAFFDRTRRPHVNKLIEIASKQALDRQRRSQASGTQAESDCWLRERVSGLGDVAWLAEHDVESEFKAVIGSEVTTM